MIGVLYESNEWSDFKLARELEACGHSVYLIDMANNSPEANESPESKALSCTLLVSRVFASAQFRNHSDALIKTTALLKQAEQQGITLVNPARAHSFEIDKRRATEQLAAAGLAVPQIYACDVPQAIDVTLLSYPCVIKPNCGGRSSFSAIAHNAGEAHRFLQGVPHIDFLVEEFIASDYDYLLRAEVVGTKQTYLYRRSIGEDGLSSYHCGSSYVRESSPSQELLEAVRKAAEVLSFELGSFDIIAREGIYHFIDANAVTNVSEDCNELLGIDLMKLHARYISDRYKALQNVDSHMS